MYKSVLVTILIVLVCLVSGCGHSGNDIVPATIVNSLEDIENPPSGTVTLRSALNSVKSGDMIGFDSALDGKTITLTLIAEEHSILKGEVMGMRTEASGPVSYLEGYFDRDYGRSALYAKKDIVLDASMLPNGITLAWAGGSSSEARILCVYGDLAMKNVRLTGGTSRTKDISDDNADQPWTLARGGAVAVWGTATLEDCVLYNNHCVGDFDQSRDRGAFGGGIYANTVLMNRCIVSGNTVLGAGAAGGGVYTVGGVGTGVPDPVISRSSVTGNCISGLFTYGGGVYSDGGGIGNSQKLTIENSTIADNLVQPVPNLPSFLQRMGYWRGGGVYISNGDLKIKACTITGNEVSGYPRTDDLGKPNMAGAVAATIGNAHAVEEMMIGHSVIAGNTVNQLNFSDDSVSSYNQDIFTGSLIDFKSLGYNLLGVVDFSQILVPVGEEGWWTLIRKHYPETGDVDGVTASDVLDISSGIIRSDYIASAGVGAPSLVSLHYTPKGEALDKISDDLYSVTYIYGEYRIDSGSDNFLTILLKRIEDQYGLTDFESDFTTDFESYLQSVDTDGETEGIQPYTDPSGVEILTLDAALWFGPSTTWPKEVYNYPYIEFWHRLDTWLENVQVVAGLGNELLGEDEWDGLFSIGFLTENDNIYMGLKTGTVRVLTLSADQNGGQRPVNIKNDIGAIELQ